MLTKSQYETKCRKVANDMKKSMKAPKGMVNPELDHIVPVIFGYTHKIPWEVISLRENFVWITRGENRSKSETLTEDGKKLLRKWYEEELIETAIGQSMVEYEEYDFSSIINALEKTDTTVALIPTNVAVNQKAVWCQRDETVRWTKTKHAIGHVYLQTHQIMMFFVYPDGTIERGDGNTRSYVWRNNLQFPDYEVPENILGIFIKVRDKEHAELLYHSIDSTLTAETFSEKLSGYIRHKGFGDRLPKKWKKGESVYDIAVVALENYIAPGETEYATMERTNSDGEKAAKTAEKMDYFIEELVMLGNYIGKDNVPRQLTAPLFGMMIRFLMKSKDNKTVTGIKTLIDYVNKVGYTPWLRQNNRKMPELRNLYIMLDELQTSADIGESLNPHIKVEASSRRIIPNVATKTTANVQDRRMYCGWIAYCFDKFLNGEVMEEDIIHDVTGKRITNKTTYLEAEKLRQQAVSTIMSHYDHFWK